LAAWGVAADHIHTEIFGTLESITPGMKGETHAPHLPAEPAGFGPQVSFARSGLTLPWNAKYHSLLELAEACDVPVRWSRPLPSEPSSVTVIQDWAGRYFASFVTEPGWSGFVAMLEYKARLHGRAFIKIGRFEPTTRTCSACGIKDGPKPLYVRAWQCPACGVWLDRDVNAAVNVAKAAGLAVTACRAQVRPGLAVAPRSEAGTLRGAA